MSKAQAERIAALEVELEKARADVRAQSEWIGSQDSELRIVRDSRAAALMELETTKAKLSDAEADFRDKLQSWTDSIVHSESRALVFREALETGGGSQHLQGALAYGCSCDRCNARDALKEALALLEVKP